MSMEENNDVCLCGACRLRCLDLHPTIRLDLHGFSFFKIMERDFTSCLEITIPIPMPFKFEEKEELQVLLMGQSGQLWTAKVCVGDDERVVLRNGWETFVSDNHLSVGDVVVFNHIFSTHFVVQVFGSNGHEKRSRRVESKSCIQGSGNCKQIVKVVSKKRKKHVRGGEEELKSKSALVEIGFQESVEMPTNVSGLSSYHMPKEKKLKKTSALVRKKYDRVGEKELESNSALVKIGSQETDFADEMAANVFGLPSYHMPKEKKLKKTSALLIKKHDRAGEKELESNSALVKIGSQETDFAVEMAAKVSALSSYHLPKTKKLKKTFQTEDDIVPINAKMSRFTFASDLSQRLAKAKYPNFVKLLTDSAVGRGYRLSIPKEYRDSLLNSINEVIITNHDDNSYTWKQEIVSYNQFYGFHSRGWKSFVEAHNLKKLDICVFELVGTNRFKVYILKLEDQWQLEP